MLAATIARVAGAKAPTFASRNPLARATPARMISVDALTGRDAAHPRTEHAPDVSLFEAGLAFDLFEGPSHDARMSKKAWSRPEPLTKTAIKQKKGKFEALSEQIISEGVQQGVGLAVRSARATNRQVRRLVRRVTDSAMAAETETEAEVALESLYLENERPLRPHGPRR